MIKAAEQLVQQAGLDRVDGFRCCWKFELVSEIRTNHLRRSPFFPECVARVPVSLGGLGVRLCSPSFAFATATVRNRSQPFTTVRNRPRYRRKALHSGECVWSGPESVPSFLFVAAVILVSAEEVSERVICVAAIILVFAEEVSVRVICDAAVLLVSAEEVSV